MKITPQFVEAVQENLGAQGEALVEKLPALLRLSVERWGLTLDTPFNNLTYNYVTPGRDTFGQEIVLKIGLPTKELQNEAEALKLFSGRGAIRLVDALPKEGILLLERVMPGVSLIQENDEAKAANIAAHTMKKLWVDTPRDSSFPSVADWMKGFVRLREKYRGSTGPLPEDLVEESEKLAKELLLSSTIPKLLHGDLHQDNILQSGTSDWIAIDPKGVIGDPTYEVGAFLRNPAGLYDDPVKAEMIVDMRLTIFAEELEFSRPRMLKWAFVQAVLSAWWVIEDGGASCEPALKCARVLKRLLDKDNNRGNGRCRPSDGEASRR